MSSFQNWELITGDVAKFGTLYLANAFLDSSWTARMTRELQILEDQLQNTPFD